MVQVDEASHHTSPLLSGTYPMRGHAIPVPMSVNSLGLEGIDQSMLRDDVGWRGCLGDGAGMAPDRDDSVF